MTCRKKSRGVLAVAAVAGAMLLGGCGSDTLNQAQDDVQQEATNYVQGMPGQALDARQQAEDAANQLQQQLDGITNGTQP